MEKTNATLSLLSEDHLGFRFSFDGTNIFIGKLNIAGNAGLGAVCNCSDDAEPIIACLLDPYTEEDLLKVLSKFRLFLRRLLAESNKKYWLESREDYNA